jgi:hypothetical protein
MAAPCIAPQVEPPSKRKPCSVRDEVGSPKGTDPLGMG